MKHAEMVRPINADEPNEDLTGEGTVTSDCLSRESSWYLFTGIYC